jgi:two-component system C4-dicarboxylate transport sensor histidine kinase DctB
MTDQMTDRRPLDPLPDIWRRLTIAAIGLALIGVTVASYLALAFYFVRSEAKITPQRAAFFAGSLDAALTRLEHLPYVVSIDPTTLAALETGDVRELNPILADIAVRAQAEFVYLLDINGLTIASSNYRDADTLVGNSYTFRPYFRDAISGGEGRYYAVGVTTGRPGYFIAEPVRNSAGTIFGVVAVKIAISDLSRVLLDSGELVLVTSDQGVVLTSSDPELVYGLMSPLTAFARRALENQQQFGGTPLKPLDWTERTTERAQLNGVDHLWTRAALAEEDWTLHLLTDIGEIQGQAVFYVAIGVMTALSLAVAAAFYRAMQLRRALAISNEDRQRLVTEIEDRERAETRLEAARAELARQNQLAALGQLSASITHELGQPISAMRNYLTAEEIGTGAKPGGLWPELTGLVERMQGILNQLRLFGRSSPRTSEAFPVQATVIAAQNLVQHTADAAGVSLTVTLPDTPCALSGQFDRFEQVIVNILLNAVDAAQSEVHLTLENRSDQIILSISDDGPGLGDLNIADLREPFFSTKSSGKGMGLGLAISGQIVNEMGGQLDASDTPSGVGALFRVTFSKDAPDA